MCKKPILILFFALILLQVLRAQCNGFNSTSQSPRIANYQMDVVLDHEGKKATCNQTILWKNTSPDTIYELRLYMYLNAFKNTNSTFLKGAGNNIFGEDISKRTEETWGWIDVTEINDKQGNDLSKQMSYIQPDDGNKDDQTVLSIPLIKGIPPGESATYKMDFTAKLPKTIVRSGYGKNDFFLFVHWFPQIGVYEQNEAGNWGWNCHQFFRQTEFYSDFGTYTVNLTVSDHLVIGASGCEKNNIDNKDGTKTITYEALDVIDFAWVAYSDFEDFRTDWNGIDIQLLIPPEHCMMVDRYFEAIKNAFEYLDKHVGPYPYPSLTIVDPPLHSLRSGFMEYPMLITCASFYHFPKNIRSVESLAIHEFTHMYFMATLASNEKEASWLDEGFVTYFEDEILDHYYGKKNALFEVLGFTSGNKENSRLEYTSLANPSVGTIARPGWEIKEAYKPLVYAKTATMLQTLKGYVGEKVMDEIIKSYYDQFKFTHPREQDFRSVVESVTSKYSLDLDTNWIQEFLDECLHGTEYCDYEVAAIRNIPTLGASGIFDPNKQFKTGEQLPDYNSSVKIYRIGGMIAPLEILIGFDDGKIVKENWNGRERVKYFNYQGTSKIISAQIDPDQKIYLDLDFNNNSMCTHTHKKPLTKYSAKAANWLQHILQAASFLL